MPDAPSSGSFARGTVARFGAEALGALFGLLVGALTARFLGPAGKGTLSALTYSVALAAPLCALGLGEATQTLLGQRRVSLQQATSGVVAALLATTMLGILAFGGLVLTQFVGEIPGLRTAILAAALTLPLITFVTVLAMLLESAGQVVYVAAVRVGIAAVTATSTVLLVYGLEKAITGALLAIAVGWGAGLVALLVRLQQLGATPVPRWDSAFLRQAVPLGRPTQLSYLVIVASTRVDLLFVRVLTGQEAAGYYSVALTVGQLSTYAPVAMSVAAFPLIARSSLAEARRFSGLLCRATLAAGLVTAVALGCLVPFLVPLAFGAEFRPAVAPTLVLLVGGVLWGAQWVACRCESARGRPRVLLLSFGVSLAVMVVGDLMLIPVAGVTGAALASAASPLAGLAVLWARRGEDSVTPAPLDSLPRPGDLPLYAQSVRKVFGPAQPAPQRRP